MSYSLPSQHYTTTSITSYSLPEIIFPGNPQTLEWSRHNYTQFPVYTYFKRKLKLKYVQFPRPPTYHFNGNIKLNILQARLRQKCSSLRSDLFRSNLIENPICSCGVGPETAEHYILYCTKYVTARNKLKNNIELINIPFVLNVLLYGDEGESHETHSSVFQQIQLFIKETGRFID